jgi:transcriptional regulator with XRE-family HTH domain
MDDMKPVIAKNIIALRKSMNLTQAELAAKLNYSDKAVSKWERAESIPDVTILKTIADLFSVTVDYLLQDEHMPHERNYSKQTRRNRLIIALLSASLVFLVATIVFVGFGLGAAWLHDRLWTIYVYAVPFACIVLLIFNAIWGRRRLNFVLISFLVWSVLLSFYIIFLSYSIWLIFIIGIPAEVIIILWANIKPSRIE